MNDENTMVLEPVNGTPTVIEEKPDGTPTETPEAAEPEAKRGPFASIQEAEAVGPDKPNLQLFAVTNPKGQVSYFYADGTLSATIYAARADGYKASKAIRSVHKDSLKVSLANLTDEELAELGLTRKKLKKKG